MRNEGEVIANNDYIISINKLKDKMGRNATNEQRIVSLATCEVKRKKKKRKVQKTMHLELIYRLVKKANMVWTSRTHKSKGFSVKTLL